MNAIETNHLTRTFGNRVAVDDLTLAIPEGTIFGFLGPKGAGKTTTVRLLSALIAPARVVRDFIKALRAERRTIFLTTHNLPEADELCDAIGVFRSRLLRLGTPAQLRGGMFGSGTQVRVVGDAARWLETVRALSFVREATASESTLSVSLTHPDEQNPELVRVLVEAGARIRAVEPTSHSLEEVYLELVESEREAAAVRHSA